MKRIYLDYASLTPIDPRVTREMKKYAAFSYANPSSLYKEGVAAKKALEEARQKVAEYLHAHPDEIIFTGGGTESNNIAIQGVTEAFIAKNKSVMQSYKKPHIIISSIEHSSIIETVNKLESQDKCEVTRLSVDKDGIISLDEIKKSIKENTILVSIMMVNNEIGSIQPIKEIAKIIRQVHQGLPLRSTLAVYPLFHTDAAQALYEELDMRSLGVDLLTLDGGKVYGPRGIGALYVKRSVIENKLIEPIIFGGEQESGLRSGTENIPSIIGLAEAIRLINMNVTKDTNKEAQRLSELKKQFIAGLQKIRPDITVNGSVNNSAPHIVNISIPNIDNEFFLFQLDAKGIACSTKSSCMRDEDESYVLKSIGANSNTSLRFSFGRWTKKDNIKKALSVIKSLITNL
jgi:cysteine desulfurase